MIGLAHEERIGDDLFTEHHYLWAEDLLRPGPKTAVRGQQLPHQVRFDCFPVLQVEFNELSKILGTDVSVQELGDLFKEVDLDGNGTMDFEEFKTMMMKMSDN